MRRSPVYHSQICRVTNHPQRLKFCQNKNIEYEKCMEGKIVMTNRGHSDKVRCGRESENMVCGEPVT